MKKGHICHFSFNHLWLQATVGVILLTNRYILASNLSPDAAKISHPGRHNVRINVDIGNASSVIVPISRDDEVCVLNYVAKGAYVPVGRSYNGNEWESPAGIHSDLTYKCDDKHCETTLPTEDTYFITCYHHSLKDTKEVTARFLEKASFGATPAILDEWDATDPAAMEASFARFIHDEIGKNATSHREYYRRRLTPKSIENYKYGMAGPRACDQNSRWRKYSFTRKDAHLSTGQLQHDTATGAKRPNPRHTLVIDEVLGYDNSSAYVYSYAGAVRTISYDMPTNKWDVPLNITKEWYICTASEKVGGGMSVRWNLTDDRSCFWLKGGNPPVNLDSRYVNMFSMNMLNFTHLTIGTSEDADLMGMNKEHENITDLMLMKPVEDNACDLVSDPYDNDSRSSFIDIYQYMYPMWNITSRFDPDPPTFALLPDGEWAVHDYHLLMKENTLENPTPDGGGQTVLDTTFTKNNLKMFPTNLTLWWYQQGIIRGEESATFCVNAVPNLFNRDHCKISYEPNTCSAGHRGEETDMFVTFDEKFLEAIRHNETPGLSPNVIVGMEGLEINEESIKSIKPPCQERVRSRWIPIDPVECEVPDTSVHGDTINAFSILLRDTIDINPLMRDIFYYEQESHGIKCHEGDSEKFGFKVSVTEGNETLCFENVHPDHLSMYDITTSITNQTHGEYMDEYSPFGMLHFLSIPNVTMSDWDTNCNICPKYVARMGDVMTVSGASHALLYNPGAKSAELRNRTDHFLEYLAIDLATVQLKGFDSKVKNGGVLICGSPNEVLPDPMNKDSFDIINGRLDANDFGPQKLTVWTNIALNSDDQLRQRMAWALNQLLNVNPTKFTTTGTEQSLYLYDMYVRNALGNYKELLREFSFNPKAGIMMTHLGNKSIRLQYDLRGKTIHPDENYAREFMQLFTIGLHKLNMDGTEKKDRFGQIIYTFKTPHVLTYARLWTGLGFSPRRGNYEELDHTGSNYMEPMSIDVAGHDFFPKINLEGGYIGDRMPLCWDLPERAFLRKGAKFYLLAGSPIPRYHAEPAANKKLHTKRLVLDQENSELYKKICNPTETGECQFMASVTLDEHINCYGVECAIEKPVVIQVVPGVFYEYVRIPCVQLAFYEGAKKITESSNRAHMCAHPKMPVAMTACCGTEPLSAITGTASCEYTGEQVTYDFSKGRCKKMGGHVCDHSGIGQCNNCCAGYYNQQYPVNNGWYWTNKGCKFQLKVRMDGVAAIVHKPELTTYKYGNSRAGYPDTVSYVRENRNMNFMNVHWPRDKYTKDELFPTVDNNCWEQECIEMDDWTCLCDVSVEDEPVFSSMPSRNRVLKDLLIGAFDIDLYDINDYKLVESSGGVEVYAPTKAKGDFTMDTVFKVTDKFGETKFLKNMKSTMKIGKSGYYAMQNPSHFIDFAQFEKRDVIYEIEAAIDGVFRNENTPPFISKQLIQRLGISNPSPRYVKAVATAFFNGVYEWTDGVNSYSYGTNQYGDLAATAAAILLDREAVTVSLDADPTHGSLREPLMKTVSYMRAMDYTPVSWDRNDLPKLSGLSYKTGQEPYSPPDQFSFFNPEYMPTGAFQQADLLSPESELLSMSCTIGMTHGFFSLVSSGLSNDWGGFGGTSSAVGFLRKTPDGTKVEDKIDELGRMLTSGRLGVRNKEILTKAYNDALDSYSSLDSEEQHDYAWKTVQQLISTTPEFHSTNVARMTTKKREPTPQKEPLDTPYKAVVVLFLFGGLDSFNLLAPHESCGELYDSYAQMRGDVALAPEEMLTIPANNHEQPCRQFGLHYDAGGFKKIFDAKEGLFIANAGHLHKPVTKDNYDEETRTDLFSHTSMAREGHSVDAFRDQRGTGVLGRLMDASMDNDYTVGPNAVGGGSYMLGGDPLKMRLVDVFSPSGTPRFARRQLDGGANTINDILPYVFDLNAESDDQNGLFADLWSQTFVDVYNKTETLHSIINAHPTNTNSWPGGLGQSFRFISQMIKAHKARKKNRDVFYINMGGFDAHEDVVGNLDRNIKTIDNAFTSFRNEMISQGNYDKVTVVMESEMGRTITPNSRGGTDHAWGGNYFIFGGEVRGGRVIGKYPETFWSDDATNLGRGRIMPTTSWDAIWFGISQWYGVKDDKQMDYVLPNNGNFGCFLLTDKDLYRRGKNELSGCGGVSIEFNITAFISEPRYLTGKEQKKICEMARAVAGDATNMPSRCMIIGQKILVVFARRLSDGTIYHGKESLKDYLNSGGSRRLVGEPTFIISANPMLSYSNFVLDKETNETRPLNAYDMESSLRDSLESVMMETVVNMTGLHDVEVKTLAPTVSSAPTTSARPSTSTNPTISMLPSSSPTDVPSVIPTITMSPSTAPTDVPSATPSISVFPSSSPTGTPTGAPTSSPTAKPTAAPSPTPSGQPTSTPSSLPSQSLAPSGQPTSMPSSSPSRSRMSMAKYLEVQLSKHGEGVRNSYMFTVASKEKYVTLYGLDLAAVKGSYEAHVTVYIKSGKYSSNKGEWTKFHTETIQGKGAKTLISLSDFEYPIEIEGGEEISFYVFSEHKVLIGNTCGKRNCNDQVTEDDDLVIYEGVAQSRLFTRTKPSDSWRGAVRYKHRVLYTAYLETFVPTEYMTSAPTVTPTRNCLMVPGEHILGVPLMPPAATGISLMQGHMFTVVAKHTPVMVHGLEVAAKKGGDPIYLMVYVQEDDFTKVNYRKKYWNLIHEEVITGNGNTLVPLKDFKTPVHVEGEMTFYVTATIQVMIGNMFDQGDLEDKNTENADILIQHGSGLSRHFARTKNTRGWMGNVRYSCNLAEKMTDDTDDF